MAMALQGPGMHGMAHCGRHVMPGKFGVTQLAQIAQRGVERFCHWLVRYMIFELRLLAKSSH